jgi:ABC-type multidrug transport system fused ATPase/permease subunit
VSAFLCAGIKAIKLYAWEQPYIDRINELREAELKMIRKAAFYQIFNTIMFGGGPILVSLASFGAFTMLGYPLTASVAFPALALFNLLRFPVMMFPNQIMNLIAAKVALDRIQKYMQVGCCAVLCCAVLCCAVLCCAVLCSRSAMIGAEIGALARINLSTSLIVWYKGCMAS